LIKRIAVLPDKQVSLSLYDANLAKVVCSVRSDPVSGLIYGLNDGTGIDERKEIVASRLDLV